MWTQNKTNKENKLIFKKDGLEIYFTVPDFVELDRIHVDQLKLCEWLMFSPWDKEILKDYKWSRKVHFEGNEKIPQTALAYSGGMDSTAALTLLERMTPTVLTYMQRDGITDFLMKQENALHSFELAENIRRQPEFIFKTNFEIIRHRYDKKLNIGFSTDLCVLIGAILIADYFDIKYLSTGMMLESAYLEKGWKYRDFKNSKYWNNLVDTFRLAGFELLFPCLVCSEILTTKIAENGRYYGVGQSCVRSNVGGRGCMNCYKCFRKNMIQGKLIPINRQAEIYMAEEHIKQGASLVHAHNKFNFQIPQLMKYKDWDLSYLEDFFIEGLECIPEEFQVPLHKELIKYARPMEFDLKKFEWGKI